MRLLITVIVEAKSGSDRRWYPASSLLEFTGEEIDLPVAVNDEILRLVRKIRGMDVNLAAIYTHSPISVSHTKLD